MKRVLDIPTQLACSAELTTLRHAGQELTEVTRKELLTKLRAGEFVDKLTVDAKTFLQSDEPNRKFVRLKPGILASVAKSFKGVPFLKDHAGGDFDARGGTVRNSKLGRGEDGQVYFLQTLELVKPWAIEAALDGTMDRFSIRWHSEQRPLCSLDGIGVETSAVSVPAVLGTSIEQIYASLSAMRTEKGPQMKELLVRFASALGLPTDTGADAVVAEASKLKIALDAEKQAHEGVKTALREVREKADAERREQLAAGVEAEVERGIREGKFAPEHDKDGKRVESPLELAIRSAGKAGGVAAAKQVVDSLVRIHPVGLATPTGIDPPTKTATATLAQIEAWKTMGYSAEQIEELSKASN